MDIDTIAVSGPDGLEAQTDYRGPEAPDGILIALADGRVITIGHADGYAPDMLIVHGPDMETLLRIPLPEAIRWPLVEQALADALDSPAGAGDLVEADRG